MSAFSELNYLTSTADKQREMERKGKNPAAKQACKNNKYDRKE